MNDIETRAIPECELRIADDGESPRIIGYAAVFDVWSPDYGGFREIVRPGAFKATLGDERSDVRGLFNHNPDKVLGRESAGTMTLEEDKKGLRFDIPVGETTVAQDVVAMIRRGDITGSSFSFTVRKEGDLWEFDENGDGVLRRELLALDLFDVGPVTFPFYPQTKAAVRSMVMFRESAERAAALVGWRRWHREIRLRRARMVLDAPQKRTITFGCGPTNDWEMIHELNPDGSTGAFIGTGKNCRDPGAKIVFPGKA